MRCPNCGTESNIATGFCVCCGSPLPDVTSPNQPEPIITPIAPGEKYFPPADSDVPVRTLEKLEIDTSFEDAAAKQAKRNNKIIIGVVCGALALIAIIVGIIFSIKNGAPPEETTLDGGVSHSYDAFYESVNTLESNKNFFISSEISTPDGKRTQLKYATDGTSVSAFGLFDDYNIVMTAEALYIISSDEKQAALVTEDMLSLCKGFTKEACFPSMAVFGLTKPESEPVNTVNGADGDISCTFTASDEQKAGGIHSYTAVYDKNGILRSIEYFNDAGLSVKTVKINEVTGAFDPMKYFVISPTITVFTKANDVRSFLASIFEAEIQGDVNISDIGMTCTVPIGLFAVYNGVKQEDAIRCGFTEVDTATVLGGFDENTYLTLTDGTTTIGKLSVFSTSSADYASLSSITDTNNSLMDYYATSYDAVSFSTNCIYNNIRYAVMEASSQNGQHAIIYDTVHAGLHLKFIFTFTSKELASQSATAINELMKSISITPSAITASPSSEYPAYAEFIDDYGLSCTVPAGWFAVSADSTQNEASALGFTSLNIDSLKSLLEPDGGIFAVLTSPQTADNITCEFYAAQEADRSSLNTTQLNICKSDISEFYREKYGSSTTIEETVKYNNSVFFVINTGNKLIYDTVSGGYYYVFSINSTAVSDSVRKTMSDFVATVIINTTTVTAVPSVTYVPQASQEYTTELGTTGLSCTVPSGWLCISSETKQSEATARGVDSISVSDYTGKINNSERLVSCIVCGDSATFPTGAEIDFSAINFNSANFYSMNEEDFGTVTQTFTNYYVDAFDSVEYSGTVTFNGLKYIIFSAYLSGTGVRIYETVHNGVNYTIYMEGSSGALSPTELSQLNRFVSSITD